MKNRNLTFSTFLDFARLVDAAWRKIPTQHIANSKKHFDAAAFANGTEIHVIGCFDPRSTPNGFNSDNEALRNFFLLFELS